MGPKAGNNESGRRKKERECGREMEGEERWKLSSAGHSDRPPHFCSHINKINVPEGGDKGNVIVPAGHRSYPPVFQFQDPLTLEVLAHGFTCNNNLDHLVYLHAIAFNPQLNYGAT